MQTGVSHGELRPHSDVMISHSSLGLLRPDLPWKNHPGVSLAPLATFLSSLLFSPSSWSPCAVFWLLLRGLFQDLRSSCLSTHQRTGTLLSLPAVCPLCSGPPQ